MGRRLGLNLLLPDPQLVHLTTTLGFCTWVTALKEPPLGVEEGTLVNAQLTPGRWKAGAADGANAQSGKEFILGAGTRKLYSKGGSEWLGFDRPKP